ncbi:hypothetical protein DUI87_12879 [Hirundo rustica rustica]|uniref:Uncharacterized protein n=1 Tax=Hirundo rustica rustica TaxID=333673 RepID=A0A3M0KC74_HIRRU|nr:hypothetical protein DUI87_12879 [Hirundo rustica rustica]
MILPLYFAKAPLEHCFQLWGPQQKKDTDLSEGVQRRTTKLITELEHLSCEDRLRELGLFTLEKRKLWENLIVPYSIYRYLEEDKKGAFRKGV